MSTLNMPSNSDLKALDTLPKWLRHNYQKYGAHKTAMRHKDFGIWNSYSWGDCYKHCRYFGLGLASLGLQRGDRVIIVGDNDPHWYWAEYGSQAMGAVIAGLFVDSLASEFKYIIGQCEATFVIAKDQEQVDKVLSIAPEIPSIKKIIYWEDKGMWSYDDPLIMCWEEVEKCGKKHEEEHPGIFEENIDMGKGSDYAAFMYTSGTTSLPKGAMHSHTTLLNCGRCVINVFPWTDKDDYVSTSPPGYVGDQMFGVTGLLLAAPRVNFPEEPETMMENIREVAPQFLMLGPRHWAGIASMVMARMLNSTQLKQVIYKMFQPIGDRKVDTELKGKKLNVFWNSIYMLGHLLVFRPLKDKIGMIKLRFGVNAGGPLPPDTFRFFRAIGVPIVQLYGFTELIMASGHLQVDPVDNDTVGRVAPGSEVRVTEDNEMLVRSAGLFLGYYQAPDKTEEARGDGWFHTKDAGHVDDKGRVTYWDRVADLLQLRDGTKFPPQLIEGKLKFSPYIMDCMVLGKERDYVAAIIAIDFELTGKWAEDSHLAYTTFIDLSQKKEVIDLVEKEVERVNKNLPEQQKIRRFVNLYKQFDADEAELTRTGKLRRSYMEDRYKGLIDAIYADDENYYTEAPVIYRDGRTGVIKAEIKLTTVK
ncbi:MAG: AMP-binding protein [Dehalococcoidia bacterium]|nr:AMP-binding protein [Dehalococcoidia bacterium]